MKWYPRCKSYALCTPSVPTFEPLKWEGVSFVKWSEFNLPETISIPCINIYEGPSSPKATFTDVKARKVSKVKPSHNANQP